MVLTNDEIIKFFYLIERANNQQLFAMIEYMTHEVRTRNEQEVIRLRETFINERHNRILKT